MGIIVTMNSPRPDRGRSEPPSPIQVDAVLRASRALVGIAAASMAGLDDVVTVPQFRALVMVYSRGPLNLAAVAAGLNVNPSNASRTCDRLIKAGLLDRRESALDRRHVALSLTPAGRRLVEKVTRQRRTAIQRILRTMSMAERDALTEALGAFADAAGEPADDAAVLTLLWPTTA